MILTLGFAVSGTVQAFPITFAQELCTLPGPQLEQEVSEFQDKIAWVRKLEAVGSAHRKHVERHVVELSEALGAAANDSRCSEERRVQLQQFVAELE